MNKIIFGVAGFLSFVALVLVSIALVRWDKNDDALIYAKVAAGVLAATVLLMFAGIAL